LEEYTVVPEWLEAVNKNVLGDWLLSVPSKSVCERGFKEDSRALALEPRVLQACPWQGRQDLSHRENQQQHEGLMQEIW
jgi:hypothetical protein